MKRTLNLSSFSYTTFDTPARHNAEPKPSPSDSLSVRPSMRVALNAAPPRPRLFVHLRRRSLLRLAAGISALLVLVGGGTKAQAGPHHWWTWRNGTISKVDPAAQTLALSAPAKAGEILRWTKETREWIPSLKSRSGQPVDPATLHVGDTVRVLVRKDRSVLLAKRIVVVKSHS